MAGKEVEPVLEEGKSGPSSRCSQESSIKTTDEKNKKGEVMSKSTCRQGEETRGQERVLTRAADEREKSKKAVSDQSNKRSEKEQVQCYTFQDIRTRRRRQKVPIEDADNRKSAAAEEQELTLDASEDEETKSEEKPVDMAEEDTQEQIEEKMAADDIEDSVSYQGDVRGSESPVRQEEVSGADMSVSQRKRSEREEPEVAEVAKRMRTRLGAVREAEGEEAGTMEGGGSRAGHGRGNRQVGQKDLASEAGGDAVTRPQWRDGRRRRCRTKYSKDQLMAMEELFMRNRYPDIVEREELADRIGLTEDRIQVWFQNRRSRWRARERKMQKVVEGTTAKGSQEAKPDGLNSSITATSQPSRPLPVLIIPAAGFPMMQQYFAAMSGTDGANDHGSAGIPMVLQCQPATHSQHAKEPAPSASGASTETTDVTTSCTATKPRNIAPKVDGQRLPFPYTIGLAYFPSQATENKGLTNRGSQTVSASLVIPANQGQLGSAQDHRAGGAGPTLSPLLRAVESELQSTGSVSVSAAPSTPANYVRKRDAHAEAYSSSMQLRSRSSRPGVPVASECRSTQRGQTTGGRCPLSATSTTNPQAAKQIVVDATDSKTQEDGVMLGQSVTPQSGEGTGTRTAQQGGACSITSSRPCVSTIRSIGTGFTKIDHSGRIQATGPHEGSHHAASSLTFQPALHRRVRTFSEGSGSSHSVPTGCFLSRLHREPQCDGVSSSTANASSTLLTGVGQPQTHPVSVQILHPRQQEPSCKVGVMSDSQGVIVKASSSSEIFRAPPRRRANSLNQDVLRQDATPSLKAPPVPVMYGQSSVRGHKMPQALFEDMHSPPPRVRVASLSDILPCTRQTQDCNTGISRRGSPDRPPAVHSAPPSAPHAPPMSDVISLAFRTVNSPLPATGRSAGTVYHVPVTQNIPLQRPRASPAATNQDYPRPLSAGKEDKSVHGGEDVVYLGKVSCPDKPEVERDNADKGNPNCVLTLENCNTSQACLHHVELMPCTDTLEKVDDVNNNMSPLHHDIVTGAENNAVLTTVHDTSELPCQQSHQQVYTSVKEVAHEQVSTYDGLVVGEGTLGGDMTTDVHMIPATQVHGGGMAGAHDMNEQLVSQEEVAAEEQQDWVEESPIPATSNIYDTPVAASSENTRFMHTLNQQHPYMSGSANPVWTSETVRTNSEVPVAFAPTMSRANQQCLYTSATSFRNQHHGATGSYSRMVQPWASNPSQAQQQGAGNFTMNTLFLWQQNINLAQQVSLTNILARHNPFPKPQMLFTNPVQASVAPANEILGTSSMTPGPANEQSSTSMVSHHPPGLGATPRPVGDYYTSSSTKLTYVNSNRSWFGLNSQGMPATALPGIQRMTDQAIPPPSQLSAQEVQTFHK